MNRQQENHQKANPASKISYIRHENSGDGDQSTLENSTGTFLPYRGKLWFWRGVGAQVNDNAPEVRRSKKMRISVVTFALFFGCLLSVNKSAVVTQAVLHVDDSVMSVAMDIHPDALAYMLNTIDVGETN